MAHSTILDELYCRSVPYATTEAAAMTTTPDREAFLRRLEPANANRKDDAEQKVQQLLDAHNLSSLELDPISRKALCDLLSAEDKNTTLNLSDLEYFDESMAERVVEEESPEATAVADAATNKIILQQLRRQTDMILEMHNRLEELTKMVQQLPVLLQPQLTMPVQQPPLDDGQRHQPPPVTEAAVAADLPLLPRPEVPPTLFTKINQYTSSLLHQISASKTAQVWRLFWILHQQHIRLDGRLFFKVIFMVAILSVKMMGRKNSHKNNHLILWGVSYKVYVIVTLVAAGFMIQSGYLEFLSMFFWKEGYPRRIYNGEVIDPNNRAEVAVRVAVRNPFNHANLAVNNNFLGGNIHRPPINHRGFGGVLLDILYLFGSFFLSILPMWKPAAIVNQDEVQDGEEVQQPGEVGAPPNLDDLADDEHEHQD